MATLKKIIHKLDSLGIPRLGSGHCTPNASSEIPGFFPEDTKFVNTGANNERKGAANSREPAKGTSVWPLPCSAFLWVYNPMPDRHEGGRALQGSPWPLPRTYPGSLQGDLPSSTLKEPKRPKLSNHRKANNPIQRV